MAEVGIEAMGASPDDVLADPSVDSAEPVDDAGAAAAGGAAAADGKSSRRQKRRPVSTIGASRASLPQGSALTAADTAELDGDSASAVLHAPMVPAGESLLDAGDDGFAVRPAGAPTLEEEAAATIVLDTQFPGDGINFPETGEIARVHYTGWLMDGTQFEDSRARGRPLQFKVGIGQVCKGTQRAPTCPHHHHLRHVAGCTFAGFEVGVRQMSRGQRAQFTVPAILGYGSEGRFPVIPPNAPLKFEVQLIDFFDSNVLLTPRHVFDPEIDGTPRTAFSDSD